MIQRSLNFMSYVRGEIFVGIIEESFWNAKLVLKCFIKFVPYFLDALVYF